jgi:23S rRNA (pseudouridine1915-N3)-methyltransferase
MQIRIINVAQKLPAWADRACEDYLKRIPRELTPKLVTVPLAARRARQSSAEPRQRESQAILARCEAGSLNLALDERGACWSSVEWAHNLERWMLEHPRVNLIIGGPDGLAPECLQVCQLSVSLGKITLPHALVKVVLLEQLYRAWTIIQGHPYHRG